jgi:hypothetical protein
VQYTVSPIDKGTAQMIQMKNHYLHRIAPCSQAFGLFDGPDLIGVLLFGIGPSSTLLKSICGPEEASNVLELTRLWLTDDAPKNAESFFISRALKSATKEIIVSFADTSVDHIGYVYQATNWIYTGLSAKFKDPKVKGLESQHHATFAHGLSIKECREKFGDQLYYVERPRKHRYIYFNASHKRKKELLLKLRYPILPYPKFAGKVSRCDTPVHTPI